MKKLAVLLLLLALPLAGCAGIYVAPDGRALGAAIGEAEAKVTLQETQAMVPCDGAGLSPAADGLAGGCGAAAQVTRQVEVKGGKLSAGWFGVLTTLVTSYFARGAI